MSKKINYNRGKFVIATTSTDGFSYKDYLEYCEEEGIQAEDEDSIEFYEWCEDEARINFDADLENIRFYEGYKIPVVITGTLGLWWGHPEIEPVRTESVYDALERCFRGCDHVTVEFDNGRIEVSASHHDGTNCFTIRALSKKGEQRKSGEYVERDFKRLNYLYA